MKKIVSVVGARPQFIKAAPLSAALRAAFDEILVHTGQHYDEGMSDIFFEQLRIPAPDHHLGVGSATHGAQTATMLERIEHILLDERPVAVLVYGDTNSTLAGALAAAKLNIPVAHVEAGLRSFNRRMPEEVNRVVTDHVSRWLFCPSQASADQLRREGIETGVHVVGDIMLDAVLHHSHTLEEDQTAVLTAQSPYALCTVHRAENTDDPSRLRGILAALDRLPLPVVLPLHPRTRGRLAQAGAELPLNVTGIEPVGYLEMLNFVRGASVVLTDSGGLQKEAYYLGVPCVTMRDETEWTETVDAGWNVLAGADTGRILTAAEEMRTERPTRPPLYGTGDTALQITEILRTELLGEETCVASPAS